MKSHLLKIKSFINNFIEINLFDLFASNLNFNIMCGKIFSY